MIAINTILREAGWFPNRNVDISTPIKTFKERNLNIFPRAVEFMKEFYGLTLTLPTDGGIVRRIFINSGMYVQKFVLWSYMKHYSINMLPVALYGNFSILIDENGEFYMALDELTKKVGNDFYDALNNIINWTEFENEGWAEIEILDDEEQEDDA